MDHTETTEKDIVDVYSKEPTRTPATESLISTPGPLQKPTQRPEVVPDATTDAMDEDENIQIDVRITSVDD